MADWPPQKAFWKSGQTKIWVTTTFPKPLPCQSSQLLFSSRSLWPFTFFLSLSCTEYIRVYFKAAHPLVSHGDNTWTEMPCCFREGASPFLPSSCAGHSTNPMTQNLLNPIRHCGQALLFPLSQDYNIPSSMKPSQMQKKKKMQIPLVPFLCYNATFKISMFTGSFA